MNFELKPFVTLAMPCETEQVVKKSRFICRLFPAEDAEQAGALIEACKKQYWDASHNCSAYVLGMLGEYTRSSDDGEPQGTAGMPMLETLKGSGVTNIVAVVTRYFGGTLLGKGGLVRAYGSSVSLALETAQFTKHFPVSEYKIDLPFALWGKAEAQLRNNGFQLGDVAYTACVSVQVFSDMGREQALVDIMQELSAGAVTPQFVVQRYLQIEV